MLTWCLSRAYGHPLLLLALHPSTWKSKWTILMGYNSVISFLFFNLLSNMHHSKVLHVLSQSFSWVLGQILPRVPNCKLLGKGHTLFKGVIKLLINVLKELDVVMHMRSTNQQSSKKICFSISLLTPSNWVQSSQSCLTLWAIWIRPKIYSEEQ